MAPMKPHSLPILTVREGEINFHRSSIYSYSLTDEPRIPGAFRAFSVGDLLGSPATISLYEWRQLRVPRSEAENSKNYPNYAAISHVWGSSKEVTGIAKNGTALNVMVGRKSKKDKKTQRLTWEGLIDVARAAKFKGCRYLWLDFLCMDQVKRGVDDDKPLQIENMANIYKFANKVIVMVGGVAAVQSVITTSSWMDRAWTLQEAAINHTQTYALVKWPPKALLQFQIPLPAGGHYNVKLERVQGDKCLIYLCDLLEMPDLSKGLPTAKIPPGFNVNCLDGCVPGRAGNVARTALLAVFRAVKQSNRGMKWAGVWRSMLMRTADVPVDIVYSVMGLFDVKIDPYRKDRSPQYLFNDLARKAAARWGNVAWLTIGGLDGSRLHPDRDSSLIPRVPIEISNKLPTYNNAKGKSRPSGDFIDGSTNYIPKFDIKFITDSQPHIICARLFSTETIKIIQSSDGGLNKEQVKFGGVSGFCTYRGEITDGSMAVLVGTVKCWTNPPNHAVKSHQTNTQDPVFPHYDGQQYVLFIAWEYTKWVPKGDGVFRQSDRKRKLSQRRRHFTMGRGAQTSLHSWHCDHGSDEMRTRPLRYSYGIVPLDDASLPEWDKRVIWAGRKDNDPPSPHWHTYHLTFDAPLLRSAGKMGLRFPERFPLYLALSKSSDPPQYLDAYTNAGVRIQQHGKIAMQPYDVNLHGPDFTTWEKISDTENSDTTDYQVELQFRKDVIYLRSIPFSPYPSAFVRTAVAPYSPMDSERILNKEILRTKARIDSYNRDLERKNLQEQMAVQQVGQQYDMRWLPGNEYGYGYGMR